LTNSANASAGLTIVPVGAPALSRKPGKPLPSQRTLSSAWHALFSKSKSAWQSDEQNVALLCKQLYGVVITPLTITTVCCSADCMYCTT
jgi:hypothetical protein